MKAWARIDAFAPKNHKIIGLSSDAVRWSWVVMLCDGKLQKPQGQWANLKHLAGSTGRPAAHFKEMIAARLLDEHAATGAITAHNWDLWQSSSHDDPTKQERQRRYRETRREELAREQRQRRATGCDGPKRRHNDGVATNHSDGQTETETETEKSCLGGSSITGLPREPESRSLRASAPGKPKPEPKPRTPNLGPPPAVTDEQAERIDGLRLRLHARDRGAAGRLDRLVTGYLGRGGPPEVLIGALESAIEHHANDPEAYVAKVLRVEEPNHHEAAAIERGKGFTQAMQGLGLKALQEAAERAAKQGVGHGDA